VIAPFSGCGGRLAEAGVLAAQVRRGGHQVRLGNLHRGLDATLRLGVERFARLDLCSRSADPRHDHRVPHRHPATMLYGDRLGVSPDKYVGAPPMRRSAASMQDTNVPSV